MKKWTVLFLFLFFYSLFQFPISGVGVKSIKLCFVFHLGITYGRGRTSEVWSQDHTRYHVFFSLFLFFSFGVS